MNYLDILWRHALCILRVFLFIILYVAVVAVEVILLALTGIVLFPCAVAVWLWRWFEYINSRWSAGRKPDGSQWHWYVVRNRNREWRDRQYETLVWFDTRVLHVLALWFEKAFVAINRVNCGGCSRVIAMRRPV